jgi:hypothetical protein
MTDAANTPVMPGLVPGIHVFLQLQSKTWMAGTSPAMTIEYKLGQEE